MLITSNSWLKANSLHFFKSVEVRGVYEWEVCLMISTGLIISRVIGCCEASLRARWPENTPETGTYCPQVEVWTYRSHTSRSRAYRVHARTGSSGGLFATLRVTKERDWLTTDIHTLTTASSRKRSTLTCHSEVCRKNPPESKFAHPLRPATISCGSLFCLVLQQRRSFHHDRMKMTTLPREPIG